VYDINLGKPAFFLFRVFQRICGYNKDEFFAFQPRHGFEKKPLTLPSPPGEGILFPITFWSYAALT
jgi:hypothetical protein